MVNRGLAESREQAQRLIMAGLVRVDKLARPKPGIRVAADAQVELLGGEKYVSRGGLKLEAALEGFAVDVRGLTCADIGASTGGFTDCLLQHGAARVLAVDVGRPQLHERLVADGRVTLIGQTNARDLQADSLPATPSVIAVDVSFISLSKVLPGVARVAPAGTVCIALIKPQFESTRAEVSRGRGVIRERAIHRRILLDFEAGAPGWGWRPVGLIASPIAGGDGNREYLALLVRLPGADERSEGTDATVDFERGFDIDGALELTFDRSAHHDGAQTKKSGTG